MNVLNRALVTAIVIAVGMRAAAAAVFVVWDFPKRTAVYFIEPQMVHLARSVQLREPVYLEWRKFPYIVNIYAPDHFWVDGPIAQREPGDLDAASRNGRPTTMF